MVKNLFLLLLSPLILFAKIDEKEIIEFEKSRLKKNSQIELNSVELHFKKKLQQDWYAFILDVDANHKGRPVNFKDIIFSNGKMITSELVDLQSGESFKDSIFLNLDDRYFRTTNLIIGNSTAKDKIVVFADPFCILCKEYIPKLINFVEKNEDKIALYYFHLPSFQINPASQIVAKLSQIAKQKGIKDVIKKTYEIDWDSHFSKDETSKEKILEIFNKNFKTNIVLEELFDVKIDGKITQDIALGQEALVKSTPTVFINGEFDKSQIKYLELGK